MNTEILLAGASSLLSLSHLLESSFQLNLQALLHLPFVLLADASGAQEKVQQAIRPILFIILVISNIWGIIKVIQGAAAVNRGEEGYLQIIGGLLMAAAVWIVYYAFEAMGLSAARIDLKGYGG
jgi:hypothetical protein